jgi:cytochrome c peroxidase
VFRLLEIKKEYTVCICPRIQWLLSALPAAALVCFALSATAADEDFTTLTKRLQAEKPKFAQRQQALLAERYDLADRPFKGVTMSRGKPVQDGVRVKLPHSMTWEKLAAMSPKEVREKQLWPAGFLPLPHPHHEAGGMVFPKFLIEEMKKQTDRNLTRFDLDFDIPDHFLPEFPAAIYLTTRPDLGDVSQGKLVTLANFNEVFKDILNPKQLEGLRLLLTPFPQQQFNATEDRRSLKAHQGVACFDCHANGHTNASTHTVGDIRPNEHRHRIDTPSLRGVNIQRLFGSQRAMKTVEDFTEFEQRGAYFDGIPADAARKGINVLERGSQVQFMAEFQALLDFPPAPKLNLLGKLDPAKARENEMRGQEIFFGKGQCGLSHPALLHRQQHAQLEGGAFLQGSHHQWPYCVRRWPDQDIPAARHQRLAAVFARWSPAHTGGHGGILQPRVGIEAE